ncbi:MAG: flippase, partial [Deltaproteobacteria bacterium]|nr:flippase [Deltaproteobacteria bacterium]
DKTYGMFCFALSIPALFEFFISFGMGTIVVREVARDRSLTSEYMGNALTLMVVFSLIAFFVIVALTHILDMTNEMKTAIYLLTLAVVLKQLNLIFRRFFQAYEIFKLETFTTSFERCTLLIVGMAVLFKYGTFLMFCAVFPAVRAISLMVTLVVVGKHIIKPKLTCDIKLCRKLLRNAFPFALISSAYALYFRIDTIMLSFMRGDQEVGWYNAAYRLIEGMILLPTIISSVLFPRLSVLSITSPEMSIALFSKGCKVVIAFTAPITILGITLSDKVIALIYGEQFSNAAISLKISLLGMGFMFLSHMFQTMLASINRQNVFIMAMGISITFNIALNMLMIPKYGFIGASISTVITAILLFAMTFSYLRKNEFRFNLIRNGAKPVICSIIIGGLSFLLMDMPIALTSIVLVCLYILLLFILRFWDYRQLLFFFKEAVAMLNAFLSGRQKNAS